MTDIATVEEYMRTANPIPTLDMLDADELAFAVAAVDTRRATAMQAPTQHPTDVTSTAPPPQRRRPVWTFAAAFVLILVVVGGAALLLRRDDTQVTDETVPPTTIEPTPTTLAEVPPPKVALDDAGWWLATRITEPWTQPWSRAIVDVGSLPGGGFVVVATGDWGVLWSPDGVEWIDGDPQRQVTAARTAFEPSRSEEPISVIRVMGNRVVVLDNVEPGLWVGDPKTGAWESIRLGAADLPGQVEPIALASNDTQVLVLAEHRPTATSASNGPLFTVSDRGYLVWLIDPNTGEFERYPLSVTLDAPGAEWGVTSGAVEWVNDRWMVALHNSILVSPDGATWTQVSDQDSFSRFVVVVNALTAGPTGVVASTCEGWGPHNVWFSEDGVEWDDTSVANFHLEPLYSESFGFLVVGESHQVTVSPDGRTWRAKTWRFGGSDPSWSATASDGDLNEFTHVNLAVSGRTVFVHHEEGAFLLTYEERK